jgi:hypothetical protein
MTLGHQPPASWRAYFQPSEKQSVSHRYSRSSLNLPLRSRRDLPHLALRQFYLILCTEDYAILLRRRPATALFEGAHTKVPGEWRRHANLDIDIFEESCLLL